MTVELYSKPGCNPCRMSKKHFTTKGIEFTELDVSVNEDARNTVLELGYMSAPVVVVRDGENNVVDAWSGFNPDKIAALA